MREGMQFARRRDAAKTKNGKHVLSFGGGGGGGGGGGLGGEDDGGGGVVAMGKTSTFRRSG